MHLKPKTTDAATLRINMFVTGTGGHAHTMKRTMMGLGSQNSGNKNPCFEF